MTTENISKSSSKEQRKERLEDELDYSQAVANQKASNGKMVSRKEIMERLGM